MLERVQHLSHLRELIARGRNRYVIKFNGGLRSSHWIELYKGHFLVFFECDGTEDLFTDEELKNSSIGKAIERECFYCEFY